MLDDLRQRSSESEYLKGTEPQPPLEVKQGNFLQALTPLQRFIISLVLFAGSLVIGFVILLATGSIEIP